VQTKYKMPVLSSAPRVIGKSVVRLEDQPLVRGEGRFVGDISFPRQIYMRVVRSTVAHGVLRGVYVAEASKVPGVLSIWTSDDVAHIPKISFRLTKLQGIEYYRQPILATGKVRYIGEPVAVIFASNAYVAEDAAELVKFDIEHLPPILRVDGDVGPFDTNRNTEPATVLKESGNIQDAFADADIILEMELEISRHSGVPLETRGAVGHYDAGRDVLELHGMAKVPHWNRDVVASMLGRPPNSVHFYEGHVGGGFGIRGELYPEDVLVAYAALRLRRPVKWVEDRLENLVAANHSRGQVHRVRVAAKSDGRILGLEDEFWHDQGAYVRTHGATVPDLTAAMLPGPYHIPAYRALGHIRLTNKTPCGTYRAPGRYESTFVRERVMDALAARTGISAVEIRRRNFIPASSMPYARPFDALGTEVVLDSGDYEKLLDKFLDYVNWPELTSEVATRKAKGEAVGLGLAFFVEKSGLGPFDGVRVTVDQTGKVEVVTGAASVGQGIETVIAQICAEYLGVDYRNVRVVHGRTDQISFGAGAFASRVTVMTGSATKIAAEKVRDKAIEIASILLQMPKEALGILDGIIKPANGADSPSITLGEAAQALGPASSLLGPRNPGLSAEGWFHADHMAYPYGVHLARVVVDRQTYGVKIEQYAIGYDVGRAVNPMLIDGQLVGGLAQGIGGALMEEFRYDSNGEPQSVTFADYLMPTIAEMPTKIKILVTEDAPSPLNPLGVKGAGEGGTNAAGAAIAAAIDNALDFPLCITTLPATPKRLRAQIAKSNADARTPKERCARWGSCLT
jgi:aerobic carbon-monoxide dehydrogenase large subunit